MKTEILYYYYRAIEIISEKIIHRLGGKTKVEVHDIEYVSYKRKELLEQVRLDLCRHEDILLREIKKIEES